MEFRFEVFDSRNTAAVSHVQVADWNEAAAMAARQSKRQRWPVIVSNGRVGCAGGQFIEFENGEVVAWSLNMDEVVKSLNIK